MTGEPPEIGHQVRFSKTVVGYFKKGCWHIPEIMGASFMALVGIGLGITGLMRYYRCDGDNREFKSVYTIVRNGDPRACRFKNPVLTQYKC